MNVTVGKEALSSQLQILPTQYSSIKRFMGISYDEARVIKNLPYDLIDQGGSVGFKTAMGVLSPLRFQQGYFSSLKNRAEKALR